MEEIKLLILRLTERCNLRCEYCYAASADNTEFDMDEQTALRTVQLCCPPGGNLRIQFTGGEPLLRMDLIEAVAAFGKSTKRNLILSVQTNGTLLTPDICQRLKAIRCGVGVSLDGVGQANSLRVFLNGTESFDAVVQGIQNLGRLGIRCGITAVVTGTNAEKLGQLADLSLYLGNVAGVGLDLFRPIGRGNGKQFSPEPEALAHGLQELAGKVEKIRQVGLPFRLREIERIKKRCGASVCSDTYCYAQTNVSLAVDGRGDCWPCSSLAGIEGYLLGNIRNGLPESNFKIADLTVPDKCRQCASYALCLGGCPARRTAQNVQDELTCIMHQVLADEKL